MKYLLFILMFFYGCKPADKEVKAPKSQRSKVKVAAIQCFSRMGAIEENRKRLTSLIRDAAEKGAKIIVLPEASVSGYMDPLNDITWTKNKPLERELPVQDVAESVDGESVKYFAQLAGDLKVYLTIPFIESSDGKFYNTVVLASPDGEVIAHHRKQDMWKHGDSSWCSEGDLEAQVVDSEFGRLGLMICYDVHTVPQQLAEKKAGIVLYSVGWYGPNTESWYKNQFPRKHVIPNNFSVIAANWSQEKGKEPWIGCGWSNVIYKNGIVLNITPKQTGDKIVYAELFND